jgi:hypothetical protein
VRISVYLESSRRSLGLEMSAIQLAAIADLGANLGIEVEVD